MQYGGSLFDSAALEGNKCTFNIGWQVIAKLQALNML